MNNKVVVEHCGLFIYLDLGYLGSFHDVSILWQSNIHTNWCQHFIHRNKYFKYLLGEPWYMGEDIFMMRQIEKHELAPRTNLLVIIVYNKMHASIFFKTTISVKGLRLLKLKLTI